MARIKNRNSIPSVPIVWRDPVNNHPVEWRTAAQPFDTWVRKVWEYCEANGREKPTEDALDQLACTQFPHWVCDGERQATQRAISAPNSRRSGGCGSCARMR